jgi:hypothetical protein
MLIRLGYDIGFNIPAPVTIVAMLHVHPSRQADLLEPDELKLEPAVPITSYIDTFGNRCSRFVAPAGHIQLTGSTLIGGAGSAPSAVGFIPRLLLAISMPVPLKLRWMCLPSGSACAATFSTWQ